MGKNTVAVIILIFMLILIKYVTRAGGKRMFLFYIYFIGVTFISIPKTAGFQPFHLVSKIDKFFSARILLDLKLDVL